MRKGCFLQSLYAMPIVCLIKHLLVARGFIIQHLCYEWSAEEQAQATPLICLDFLSNGATN